MIRILALVALSLITTAVLGAPDPSQVSLENPTESTLFEMAEADLSVNILAFIFGRMGDLLPAPSETIMGDLFEVFNSTVLVLGVITMMYTMILSTINTAQEGEVMGKKWSSIWIPLRSIAGVGLLLPGNSGYSSIQMITMWVCVQGAAAADQMWKTVVDHYLREGFIVGFSDEDDLGVPNGRQFAEAVVKTVMCMEAFNSTAEHVMKWTDEADPPGYPEAGTAHWMQTMEFRYPKPGHEPVVYGFLDESPWEFFPAITPQSGGGRASIPWNRVIEFDPHGVETRTDDGARAGGYYARLLTTFYIPNKPSIQAFYPTCGSFKIRGRTKSDVRIKATALMDMIDRMRPKILGWMYGPNRRPNPMGNAVRWWDGNAEPVEGYTQRGHGTARRPIMSEFSDGELRTQIIAYSESVQGSYDSPEHVYSPVWAQVANRTGWMMAGGHYTLLASATTDLTKRAEPPRMDTQPTMGGTAKGMSGWWSDSHWENCIFVHYSLMVYQASYRVGDVCSIDESLHYRKYAPIYPIGSINHTTSGTVIKDWMGYWSYGNRGIRHGWNKQLSTAEQSMVEQAENAGRSQNFGGALSETVNGGTRQILSTAWREPGSQEIIFSFEPGQAGESDTVDTYNTMITSTFVGWGYGIVTFLQDIMFKYNKPGDILTRDPILMLSTLGGEMMIGIESFWLASAMAVFGILLVSNLGNACFPFGATAAGILMFILPVVIAITALVWACMATFAYYVPMIPYILFLLGGIGWIIGVIESMIASPIVALGLVVPSTDEMGKFGHAIMLITNIFLRPTLMIMGFVASMFMVRITLFLLNQSWNHVMLVNGGLISLFGSIAILVLYTGMVLILIHKSFELVTAVPDKILRWIGSHGQDQFGEAQGMQEIKQKSAEAGKSSATMSAGAGKAVQERAASASEMK